MAKLLALSTNGLQTWVDDDLYDELSKHRWAVLRNGYAYRKVHVKGVQSTVLLHRVVNQTPDGFLTDHINRDKLDNRRENLRSVTRAENALNCKTYSRKSIPFRGVTFSNGLYRARVRVNRQDVVFGYFHTPEEASAAWIAGVKAMFPGIITL